MTSLLPRRLLNNYTSPTPDVSTSAAVVSEDRTDHVATDESTPSQAPAINKVDAMVAVDIDSEANADDEQTNSNAATEVETLIASHSLKELKKMASDVELSSSGKKYDIALRLVQFSKEQTDV